jgi:hypothetical protein
VLLLLLLLLLLEVRGEALTLLLPSPQWQQS